VANDFGLFIEQKNKQMISPQMYQAIEIMQLSLPELVEYINNEMVENPLIEIAEEYESQQMEEESETKEDEYREQDKYENWLNSVVEDVLQEDKDSWTMSLPGQTQIEAIPVEGQWIDNCCLPEYLMEQLRFIQYGSHISPKAFEVAEYIIGNLDTNGYLTVTDQEIMQTLNAEETVFSQGLSIVQKLDPPGVGARSLKECLRLQFSLIPDCPPSLENMLNYLDDLASGHLKKIANALNISVAEVAAMADLLKLLDPKPGSCFERPMETKYIVPDAIIKKIEDEYFVLVNESDLPKICINERYKQVLQGQDDQTIKQFLKEKMSSAFNLLKSIEHRRSTIYDVLEAVVLRQKEFLDEGTAALKPLTMKEIAEELGLHESTVSRVASNKYVQTPRGLCSIKCFFAGSIGGEREISPEKIKSDLKKLIAGEDLKKPYSDQDLSDLFHKNGIAVARRTIAKYREELRIPSSSMRKNKKSGSK